MNNVSIAMRTSATMSAAFFATIAGYSSIDSLIAFEHAKAEEFAKAMPTTFIKLQGTSGGVDLFKPLQKGNYLLSDCITSIRTRNVTRAEDLILRRATLRAGRLISKGRFVGK